MEERIICPKCGEICSWISVDNGKVICYHYNGYENGKKKRKKHYLLYVGKDKTEKDIKKMLEEKKYFWGKPAIFYIKELEAKVEELEESVKEADGEEKAELEVELSLAKDELERLREKMKYANITLRSPFNKDRFLKYIEESLELMKYQDNFDEKKVLDLFEKFLLESAKKDKETVKHFIEKLEKEIS